MAAPFELAVDDASSRPVRPGSTVLAPKEVSAAGTIPEPGRARWGASGSLNPQSALAGPNAVRGADWSESGFAHAALTARFRALGAFEPRQVREEAALRTPSQVPRAGLARAGTRRGRRSRPAPSALRPAASASPPPPDPRRSLRRRRAQLRPAAPPRLHRGERMRSARGGSPARALSTHEPCTASANAKDRGT